MTSLVSTLLVKLIDGITAPAAKATGSLKSLSAAGNMSFGDKLAALAAVEARHRLRSEQCSLCRCARRSSRRGRGGLGVRAGVGGAVDSAAAYESAMADVRKVGSTFRPASLPRFQDGPDGPVGRCADERQRPR